MKKMLPVVALALAALAAAAQTPDNQPILPGFPSSFHWRNSPSDWSVKEGVLNIRSTAKSDWYIAPTGEDASSSSPLLLFPATKDFWFSAKVTVNFQSQWDAGALIVYADEQNWIKFAFEESVEKKASIVSVVTRGLSDDNTGAAIEGNSVYMKVSKTGQAIFLYFSSDGKKWQLTRALNLGPERRLQFGFSAQSPTGNGSTVTFSEIHYKPEALKPWSGD